MRIHTPHVELIRSQKMRSTDRIITIRPVEGKKPTSGTGLVDSGLFTGSNRLHAIQNTETTLWSLKYERGVLPIPLKAKWTSFTGLMNYLRKYFGNRNLEIVEVID